MELHTIKEADFLRFTLMENTTKMGWNFFFGVCLRKPLYCFNPAYTYLQSTSFWYVINASTQELQHLPLGSAN